MPSAETLVPNGDEPGEARSPDHPGRFRERRRRRRERGQRGDARQDQGHVQADGEDERAHGGDRDGAGRRADLAGDHRHDLEALAGEDDRERGSKPAGIRRRRRGRGESPPGEGEGAHQEDEGQELEGGEARPDAGGKAKAGGHDRGEARHEQRRGDSRGEAPVDPQGRESRPGQAHRHRGGAEERAHVGHPAHQEGHAVPEGGAGEDDRPAVLVEATSQGREGERRGEESEAGQGEDGHRPQPGRRRRDRGGDEEDADAHDPVEPEGQQLKRPDRPAVCAGRHGSGEFTTTRRE